MMADLMKALRNADAAGDADAAKRIAAMIRAQSADGAQQQAQAVQDDFIPTEEALAAESARVAARPERGLGEQLAGAGEAALSALTGATGGAAGYVVGGIEGAARELAGDIETGEGQRIAEEYASALTYAPRGEAGQEYIREIGEVAGALPPITGATPANTAARVAAAPKVSAATGAVKDFARQKFDPKSFAFKKEFSDAKKLKQLEKSLSSGNKEELAAMIDADPDFFKALGELDIKEKGLPSAASKNVQYQEIEQSLKKVPGSDLSKTESGQIAEIQQAADNIIEDFGGAIDKSELSMRLLNKSQKSIDELGSTSESAYKGIRENIPKTAQSEMQNTGKYIRDELESLGGDTSQLSSLENRLLKMSDKGATYHALDKIRKEVGETIGKKSDKYKSESTAALKNIYSKLTDDQEVVAENYGMAESWLAAKELVSKRKALEDNSIKMFGKSLTDAFMPKIGQATKKLSTGDYKKFFELIESVPKKDRQEVIISSLNDAFTMGSRKEKQLSVAGYADWYNGLSKNPRLKNTFYQYLPLELSKKLDALGTVTNGIRKAQAAAPVGGQIMASKKVFDKVVGGVSEKLISKISPMLAGIADMGMDKARAKKLDSAIDLITSNDFKNLLDATAKGQQRRVSISERALMKSKEILNFADTMPPEQAYNLMRNGIVSYLSDEENVESK